MAIEELLQTSYWVIDILPALVPKDGPGQYFAIEKYFLNEKRLEANAGTLSLYHGGRGDDPLRAG